MNRTKQGEAKRYVGFRYDVVEVLVAISLLLWRPSRSKGGMRGGAYADSMYVESCVGLRVFGMDVGDWGSNDR